MQYQQDPALLPQVMGGPGAPGHFMFGLDGGLGRPLDDHTQAAPPAGGYRFT